VLSPRPIQLCSTVQCRRNVTSTAAESDHGGLVFALQLRTEEPSLLRALHDAGVVVSMTAAGGTTSNLRWEAGLAVAQGVPKVSIDKGRAAIELITPHPALLYIICSSRSYE
jgi:hypothetical protein